MQQCCVSAEADLQQEPSSQSSLLQCSHLAAAFATGREGNRACWVLVAIMLLLLLLLTDA
jgi:hypothetical protein